MLACFIPSGTRNSDLVEAQREDWAHHGESERRDGVTGGLDETGPGHDFAFGV